MSQSYQPNDIRLIPDSLADSLVNCPICGRLVEYQLINLHMDGSDCNNKAVSHSNSRSSNAGAKNEWSKILGKGSSRKGKRKASR